MDKELESPRRGKEVNKISEELIKKCAYIVEPPNLDLIPVKMESMKERKNILIGKLLSTKRLSIDEIGMNCKKLAYRERLW